MRAGSWTAPSEAAGRLAPHVGVQVPGFGEHHSAGSDEVFREQAGTVVNGQDDHCVVCISIDDAIAVDDDLANFRPSKFGHDPSQEREVGQSIDGIERARSEDLSDLWCITRDVEANGFQVIESLRGPTYGSHRAIRLRASSCVTICPASACARPRSILKSRCRRSMASSMFASAGSASMA